MFKTTLKARLLAAATLTGAMMGGTAAWAQEAAPVSTVDEVIVTAQLREQKTIDVPFALTAYSGQFLENLGIQEFDQLSAFVPGFLVQNQSPNNPGFVMRGITSDSGAAPAETGKAAKKEQTAAPAKAAPAEPAAKPSRRKSGRSAVPSWDEILFGD